MPAHNLLGDTSNKNRNSAHLAPGSIELVRTKAIIIPRGYLGLCGIRFGLQRGTDLEGKLFQGVGLLQKIGFKIQHFVIKDGLAGVAGNEQEFRLRP